MACSRAEDDSQISFYERGMKVFRQSLTAAAYILIPVIDARFDQGGNPFQSRNLIFDMRLVDNVIGKEALIEASLYIL